MRNHFSNQSLSAAVVYAQIVSPNFTFSRLLDFRVFLSVTIPGSLIFKIRHVRAQKKKQSQITWMHGRWANRTREFRDSNWLQLHDVIQSTNPSPRSSIDIFIVISAGMNFISDVRVDIDLGAAGATSYVDLWRSLLFMEEPIDPVHKVCRENFMPRTSRANFGWLHLWSLHWFEY